MERMRRRTGLVVVMIVVLAVSVVAQTSYCDIDDVGSLTPGDSKAKVSLLHVWQGANGGVNTKNADRITGLYDLDLYYLLHADEHAENRGDYIMLGVSLQSSFGNGLTNSKVGGPFDLNENAKGDLNLIVDKAYAEFSILNRALRFNVGKIDLEDYFDGSAVAGCEKGQFLSRPLFKNAAIPFPSKGLGIRGVWNMSEQFYLQAAIADAQADKRETGFRTTFHDEDYFVSMAELGVKPKLWDKPGTYRFIVWYDPQDKSHLDNSSKIKRDDLGFAVSFDQGITDSIKAFLRYGWADDKVNSTEDFISFGAQVEGLIEGRNEDVLGVGYAQGIRSPRGLSTGDEREIELIESYYNIKVNKNLYVTPLVQFSMDPGGLSSESPATVFGIRTRIKF